MTWAEEDMVGVCYQATTSENYNRQRQYCYSELQSAWISDSAKNICSYDF